MNDKINRRDFLKIMGFSIGAAQLVSCDKPIEYTIPYMFNPDNDYSGQALYYKTVFCNHDDFSSITVKNRDGRPILIESNKDSIHFKNGINPRIQSSLIELYNENRHQNPHIDKYISDWESAIKHIKSKIKNLKRIAFICSETLSKNEEKAIKDFIKNHSNIDFYIYQNKDEIISIRKCFEDLTGNSIIPNYKIEKADCIISFNADFTNQFISPSNFNTKYNIAQEKNNFHHIQIESISTLCGLNSNSQHLLNIEEIKKCIEYIYNRLVLDINIEIDNHILIIANDILQNIKKANNVILLCGLNDKEYQKACIEINTKISDINNVIDFNNNIELYNQNCISKNELELKINSINYDGLIFYKSNLIYDFDESFCDEIVKINFKLFIGSELNETSQICNNILPLNNHFETWNLYKYSEQNYFIAQPLINKIYNTKSGCEVINLLNDIFINNYEYFTEIYKTEINNNDLKNSIKKGETTINSEYKKSYNLNFERIKFSNNKSNSILINPIASTLLSYGSQILNPYLLETSDPIFDFKWSSAILISQNTANNLKLENGDFVELKTNNNNYKSFLCVNSLISDNCIGLYYGYGRDIRNQKHINFGINAFKIINDQLISLTKTDNIHKEKIINHEKLIKSNSFDYPDDELILKNIENAPEEFFSLCIDLKKCNGCSTCVIACMMENNIPITGKNQSYKKRDLQWIQILKDKSNYKKVKFIPLMCQHCNNAPCENVCPVMATTHSKSGINQMIYNRCIGTRYCAVNCPYQVRKFNYFNFFNHDNFEFSTNSKIGKLQLNPDVMTREKGVIEKCSLCIQRINGSRLQAQKENRIILEKELNTACQNSCPNNAISFGNLKDKSSEIYSKFKSKRRVYLLKNKNTLPSVFYLE